MLCRPCGEGGKVSCYGPGRSRSDADWIWQDGAAGPLVGPAVADVPRSLRVRGLRHLGGIPGDALHVWSIPVAVLFARVVRRLPAQLVRTQALVVARVVALLAGAARPLGTGRVPVDLLLLPRRVLQGVLGRSAVVRRGRTALDLPRRGVASAHPPERPPVFHVPGASDPADPRLRRVESALVSRPGRGHALRHRRGNAGTGRE